MRMRFTKNEPGIRPTLLHYFACMLAIALVCCSLLGIYSYTTSAYASTGFLPANGKTMGQQAAFDDTETETPSPTTTGTPSPTVTTTSTPNPSPSATSAITPSPTSTNLATPTATIQHSNAVTNAQMPSPGATPASSATNTSVTTQGTGTNQTTNSSPATTNNMGDQSSQGTQLPRTSLPFPVLKIGLGSLALLGLLFISGWIIVRRRLSTISPSKFPPSGAAPWSRTRISDPTSSLHAQPTTADLSAPNLPVSSLIDDATQASTSSASHANQPVGTGYFPVSSNSLYLAARIRQRRNERRDTGSLPAFQKPGEPPKFF